MGERRFGSTVAVVKWKAMDRLGGGGDALGDVSVEGEVMAPRGGGFEQHDRRCGCVEMR